MRPLAFFLLLCVSLFSQVDTSKIQTLYYSLRQDSLKECMAFYELFPDHPLGKKALDHAFDLINIHREQPLDKGLALHFPEIAVSALIQSIGFRSSQELPTLSKSDVEWIDQFSSHLKNRTLLGHQVTTLKDAKALSLDEIDLARTLFLLQFQDDLVKVKQYESTLDLMALEILAKVGKNPTTSSLLKAMHELIFFEMGFRFPPHSLWAKDVDTFTFLPSVMDDRFGVCLGVSILYLSLGQRLGVPFFIYTPPGHIFLQAELEDHSFINIETTARGIHIPMEEYLGMNMIQLSCRTIKEVAGMALMNQAAHYWETENYEAALKIYLEAADFMPDDPLLNYFISINALCCDQKKLSKTAFDTYQRTKKQDCIKDQTMLDDYYNNKVNIDGLKLIFLSVDETRDSILKKQSELKAVLQKYPKFREGIFHLGVTHLQLSQIQKAKECFEAYHVIDQTNPTVEYYLAILCSHRLDYKKAFEHLSNAENLLKSHGKSLKILKPLRLELTKVICPKASFSLSDA